MQGKNVGEGNSLLTSLVEVNFPTARTRASKNFRLLVGSSTYLALPASLWCADFACDNRT
jgi:hypothetical protein